MAGIERRDNNISSKTDVQSKRANQTKEILHRAAASPNPSVLSCSRENCNSW